MLFSQKIHFFFFTTAELAYYDLYTLKVILVVDPCEDNIMLY